MDLELRQRDDLVRRLFQQSAEAQFVFERGVLVDFNQKAAQLMAVSVRAQLLGKTLQSLFPHLKAPGISCVYQTELLNHQGQAQLVEVAVSGLNSSSRVLKLTVSPVNTLSNVTNGILDATWHLLLQLDAEGRIQFCNRAALRVIPESRQAVLGLPLWQSPWWGHNDAQKEIIRRVTMQALKGNSAHFRAQHCQSDGSILQMELVFTPVQQADRVVRVIVEAMDVTPTYRARELERSSRQQAESANKAKSEFLAKMSHEIRTPMNAIIGMTQLALKTKLNERQRYFLETVDTSAQALMSIINDILDFSKIEAGKLELELIPFSLHELLEQLVAIVALKAQAKNLDFIVEDAEIPFSLVGDPLRLQQVLINLCDNAIKFTRQGGVRVKIRISSRTEKKVTLEFKIKDTGIGFNNDDGKRLFGPFVQADASITREFGGTGLGLSICRQLVNAMGGELKAVSRPGAGSIFHFELPFMLATEQPPESVTKSRLLKDTCVLLVDDNPVCCLTESKILRNQGCNVLTAHSSLQAVLLAQHYRDEVQIVLMDWDLPDMNGVETSQKILAQCQTHPLTEYGSPLLAPSIVMVTAFDQDEILTDSSFHPDGFLSKPIRATQLIELLEGVMMKRQHRIDNRVFTFAPPATMDPCSQQETALNTQAPRILLVEDNQINRFLVIENLRDIGLQVDMAMDGSQAMEKLRSVSYDLVLMDVQMPVMDGIECARQIRMLKDKHELPIIALTANTTSEQRQQVYASGMNGFVAKPFELNLLYSEMAACLAEKYLPWSKKLLGFSTPQVPQALLDFTGFDLQNAINRVHGSWPRYAKMLAQFISDLQQQLPKLEHMAKTGKWDDLAQACHKLKGVAANLGLNRVAEIADAVERSCVKPVRQYVDSDLASLRASLSELVIGEKSIQSYADEYGSQVPAPLPALDPQQFSALLQRVRKSLQQYEVLETESLHLLEQSLQERITPVELQELMERIASFDFSSALEKLDSILTHLNTTTTQK